MESVNHNRKGSGMSHKSKLSSSTSSTQILVDPRRQSWTVEETSYTKCSPPVVFVINAVKYFTRK